MKIIKEQKLEEMDVVNKKISKDILKSIEDSLGGTIDSDPQFFVKVLCSTFAFTLSQAALDIDLKSMKGYATKVFSDGLK